MSQNWTGTPAPEPLGIRASIRHSVWRYQIAELTGAEFTFDDGDVPQWCKRIRRAKRGEPKPLHPVRIDSVVGFHSWLTFWHETYEDGMTQIARELLGLPEPTTLDKTRRGS